MRWSLPFLAAADSPVRSPLALALATRPRRRAARRVRRRRERASRVHLAALLACRAPALRRGLPLLLPLVLLTGCLDLLQVVTLRADGSGTQRLELSVSDDALETLRQASAALDAAGGRVDPSTVFDREKVGAELAAAGLELVEHESGRVRRQRRVAVEARFADPSGLVASPLAGGAAEWVIKAGSRPGTVWIQVYPRGMAAWREAEKRARAMAEEPLDDVQRRFFARQKEQIRGLDVRFRLKVPGSVLGTCARLQRIDELTVEARLTPDLIRTPADLVRALAPVYQVVIDGTTNELLEAATAAAMGAADAGGSRRR